MKKKTQEEFNQDVKSSNPYIQVLGNYVNNATKVEVKCLKCGRVWSAVPTTITKKYICPLCERQDEFNKFLEINNLTALNDYIDNFSKIKVICKKCNYSWDAVPKTLKRDGRCPKCFNKGKPIKWTESSFSDEIHRLCPNIILKEKYRSYEEKISCECSECGYMFEHSPHQLLMGRGCPKCNGHHKWTNNEFIKKVKEVNSDIVVTGFTNISKKVHCRCEICGYEWNPIAGDVVSGHGCSRCSGHEKLNFKKFKSDFESSDNNIEILDDEVKTTNEMFLCRCKRCGNIWKSNVNRLKDGNRCPFCNHSGTSFTEQVILKAFRIRLGEKEVFSRNKSAIGKELDIYIPMKKIAFEPGCWFYHKHSIKKDTIKRKLCADRNIRLIIIYDSYKEKEAPFSDDCYVFAQGLGDLNNRHELRMLIEKLYDLCNVSPKLNDTEWKMIQKYANEHSMRKTSSDILNDIYLVNPDIVVLSKPTRVHEKVLCRCKKCSNEWSTSSSNLKNGSGCPKCGGTQKLTQEEFEHRLHEFNPHITALDNYINITAPIHFRCEICGCVWKSKPRKYLESNYLCPFCKKKEQFMRVIKERRGVIENEDINCIEDFCKKNTRTQYTTDEFKWIISKVNSQVEVIGEYKTLNDSIICKCKKCGKVWEPRAQHVLNQHGCPNCN